ncbi:MAG: hypothetical protein Wins2KO_22020 [Winogradskyella sp.]
MSTQDKCSVCGSNKLMHDLTIVDHGHMDAKHDLSVHIKTSDRLIFNTFKKSKLNACICGSCGAVNLSVNNPQELWQAYLKHKSL